MTYALNCRHCGVTVVMAEHLEDAEAAVMLDHLRAYHADVLPEGSPTSFGALIPHFRLRMA